MTEMVLGFMFDQGAHDRTLLIKKRRPEWQAGWWNGIGGKIEAAETPSQAVAREFLEETGIKTRYQDWAPTVIMLGPDWLVDVFFALGPVESAKSCTDEEVKAYNIYNLPAKVIPNLLWLIPLQLERLWHEAMLKWPIRVEYTV